MKTPAGSWNTSEGTLAMAEKLNAQIQEAINQAVPWSRPCFRSKRWWTKDISILKSQMAADKRDAIKHASNPEARTRYKQAANQWRKAIREAQWKYWEDTFQGANRNNMHKAMKAPDKPRGKEGLPVIKGISTFQGKCEVLRDSFFPANVATPPPPFPANWLATPNQDPDNTYRNITGTEIQSILRKSRMDSVTGKDNVSYRMVAATHEAVPDLLPTLFSQLLCFGEFPPAWKQAKCVPIPKPGRTDTSDPKNLRPISLLSCLGKTFEKILAQQIAKIGRNVGAILASQFGSLAERSSVDDLMMALTPTQQWLKGATTFTNKVLRPSILGNDIDGAFNCVVHERLTDILKHFKVFPQLIQTIESFTKDRTILMAFDGQEEAPTQFRSGVPQGSPLSPVLFVIYAAALNNPGQQPLNRHDTSYVDDELMIQASTSEKGAKAALQERIDGRIKRAEFLNIRLAPAKSELMHLYPVGPRRKQNLDEHGIKLYDAQIEPKKTIKALGVRIDNHLSFKAQAAAASTVTRRASGLLWAITKRKGASPNALHQLAISTVVPAMLWGSEIWWTGATHILSQLSPAYNTIARIITGLPKWTPLRFLLAEAGLPPPWTSS